MKKIAIILMYTICSPYCFAQDVKIILEDHFNAINTFKLELFHAGYKLHGTLDNQTHNLTLEFQFYQVANKYQIFDQNALLNGEDLIPQMYRIANQEVVFFSIEETSAVGSMITDQITDKAGTY